MNTIRVVLKDIQKSGEVAFTRAESAANKEHNFYIIMLDINDTLEINTQCNAVFKESEVMICDKDYTRLSARNRFVSKIENIEQDSIFARIYLAFEDKTITSLITKDAAISLNLAIGDEVAWFIKSNEIMLDFR